jgi:DNA-binding response OmpR family regulator
VKPRVLVVEDEDAIAEPLAEHLVREGFESPHDDKGGHGNEPGDDHDDDDSGHGSGDDDRYDDD